MTSDLPIAVTGSDAFMNKVFEEYWDTFCFYKLEKIVKRFQ